MCTLQAATDLQTAKKNKKTEKRYNQYSFPDTVEISKEAKDLIRVLLSPDPKNRPKLEEIANSHWMQLTQLPPRIPQTVLNNTPNTKDPCDPAHPRKVRRNSESQVPGFFVADPLLVQSCRLKGSSGVVPEESFLGHMTNFFFPSGVSVKKKTKT